MIVLFVHNCHVNSAIEYVPLIRQRFDDFFLAVIQQKKQLRACERFSLKKVYKKRRLEKLQSPEAAMSKTASMCVFAFFYVYFSNDYLDKRKHFTCEFIKQGFTVEI